jgi:AraC-like DNA-binding protein
MVVKAELEKLGAKILHLELGEVEIEQTLEPAREQLFKEALLKTGLEVMADKRAILIEKIKAVIIEMIHYADELPETNFSDFLSKKLGYDYTYLANIFTQVKGTTIEQFIILHKVEKVKELLIYDELNINEIAYKMHYSSSAHLSNQFKRITGLTPSQFKALKHERRKNLDEV